MKINVNYKLSCIRKMMLNKLVKIEMKLIPLIPTRPHEVKDL